MTVSGDAAAAPRRLPRLRLRSRWSRVAAALVVVLAALCAALLVAARGGIETWSSDLAGAPAWTKPCRGETPRHDRQLLAICSRATGLVVRVRHRGPTYSPREVHFAMLAGIHPLIVKLAAPEVQPAPSIGDRVTVVGALVRASNGMREVQAWSIR